jgi:hypothetical protein
MAANPMSQPRQGTEVTRSRSGGRGGRLRLGAPGWGLADVACLALVTGLIAVVTLTPSSVRPADHQ